jgi:IS1 family transposase
MLGKIFGRNRLLISRWICDAGLLTEEPSIDGEIKEIEFDEMWHFIDSKKENFGSSKLLTVTATVAWVLGGRDRATFRRLYDKVKHLENCMFDTDHWERFRRSSSRRTACRRKVGNIHNRTEQQQHAASLRMVHETHNDCFKKQDRVDLTIRLWCALTTPEVFSA